MKVLEETTIVVDRKNYILELCENDRGRYLNILERSGSYTNRIVVPRTAFKLFVKAVKYLTEEIQ